MKLLTLLMLGSLVVSADTIFTNEAQWETVTAAEPYQTLVSADFEQPGGTVERSAAGTNHGSTAFSDKIGPEFGTGIGQESEFAYFAHPVYGLGGDWLVNGNITIDGFAIQSGWFGIVFDQPVSTWTIQGDGVYTWDNAKLSVDPPPADAVPEPGSGWLLALVFPVCLAIKARISR